MDKYEYLTSEDLEYKSEVVERAKFEYSPLDEALNKGFKEDDKVKRIVKYGNDLMYDSIHDLINTMCLILIKYHQLTLNLIH